MRTSPNDVEVAVVRGDFIFMLVAFCTLHMRHDWRFLFLLLLWFLFIVASWEDTFRNILSTWYNINSVSSAILLLQPSKWETRQTTSKLTRDHGIIGYTTLELSCIPTKFYLIFIHLFIICLFIYLLFSIIYLFVNFFFLSLFIYLFSIFQRPTTSFISCKRL